MLLSLLFYFVTFVACGVNGRENTYELGMAGEPHTGYFISLRIGTPPQGANFLVDSGSSNFAIATYIDELKTFDYEKSKSFVNLGKEITIRYTGGSWSGFLAMESIHLGWNTSVSMQFACITSSENVFEQNTMWNGILGLAYSSIAKPDDFAEPFFETLVANGTPNIFSLSMCGPFLHSKQPISMSGKLHLGYADNESYNGVIIYTPVIREWFYEVVITRLKVGEKTLDATCSQINVNKFIVDTGTSYLAFPFEIYRWIISEIKRQIKPLGDKLPSHFWTKQMMGCIKGEENVQLFPAITVSFYHSHNSTFSLVLTPDLYLLKVSQLNDWLCFKLAISSVDKDKPAIIGATALKGFYVVFDRERKRVGFANSTCRGLAESPFDIIPIVIPPEAIESTLDCKLGNTPMSRSTFITCIVISFALLCMLPLFYMFMLWIYVKVVKLRKKRQLSLQNNLAYSIFQ